MGENATDTKSAATKRLPFDVPAPETETPKAVEAAATDKALKETTGAAPAKGDAVTAKTDAVTAKPEAAVETKAPTFNDKALAETNARPEKAEAAAVKPPSAIEFRVSLTSAMVELVELRTLDGKMDAASVAKRADLVKTVDENFQKSLPHIREMATQADAKLFMAVSSHAETEKDRNKLLADLKLAPGTKLEGDELKNRILNEQDPATQKMLIRLEVLNEVQKDNEIQAGQEIDYKHLPLRVGLEYAKFLSQYKDGVTTDINNRQNVYSSLDVLYTVNSAEMQARGGTEAIKQAGEQQAKNIRSVVPDNENPMMLLQKAMEEKDPATKLKQMKDAAALAEADKLSPGNCQKNIAELKRQIADPELKKDVVKTREREIQVTAWESLSHAKAITNVMLGAELLEQKPQDFKAARDALLKASNDSVGANCLMDKQGRPLFTTLMMVALTGTQTDMQAVREGKDVESLKTIRSQIDNATKCSISAGEKSRQAEREQDPGRKAALLNEAIGLGNQAIQQSSALSKAFGGDDAVALQNQVALLKQKPEAQRTEEEKFTLNYLEAMRGLSDLEASSKISVASWNTAAGNGAAAEALLTSVEENNPEFFNGKDDVFKNQFKAMKDGAHSVAVDNSIDEMDWYNPWKHCRRVGKFCTDNWQYIAFGAALVAAAAVTVASFGAGAPVGAAILGGAVVGLGIGTVVGGGLQYASGRESFAQGCVSALPYAAAGAAIGSGGAYYFAPVAGLGSATAGGFWATSAAGLKLGIAGGAFWNAGKVKEGFAMGRYEPGQAGWKAAAVDYGTGVAAWGAGGALLAPMAVSGGSGLMALRGAGELSKGAIVANVGKVGLGTVGLYTTPKITESGQQALNALAPMTGLVDVSKGTISDATGLTYKQSAALIEAEKKQKNAPVVAPVEEAPAEPETPSTYKPGQVNLKDYGGKKKE